MLKFAITVGACVHIVACIWFFIAKLEGFGPDSWVVNGGYLDDDEGR